MGIQLIIEGNHTTDLIAEIQTLAAALGTKPMVKEQVQQAAPEPEVEETPKKLSVKEQNDAVTQMIEAGKVDDRYDLLAKTRQKKVDDALEDVGQDEAAQEEMVAEQEAEEPAADVTPEDIRNIMSGLTTLDDQKDVQDMLIKIRGIIQDFTPEGMEVKIGNIPVEKLGELSTELKKLK